MTAARPGPLGLTLALALSGCLMRPPSGPAAAHASPELQEPPSAPLRPCYVPRVDRFYFEHGWLKIKGRELDAFKLANALWWLEEPSWNESFDARDVYGPEQQIFGTLSSTPAGSRGERQVRLLYLEEREEPQAPVLIGLRVGPQSAFFYVKTLTRGKPRNPGGGGCWGGLRIPEQRSLAASDARAAADCVQGLVDGRVKAEPWKLLPDEGRDAQYLVEYQDVGRHTLAQVSLQTSNLDGVNREKLRECTRLLVDLARTPPAIPVP